MKIGIEELKITCTIGTLDKEKENKQDIFLDVEVETNSGSSDNLDDTVDYVRIAKLCTNIATQHHYQILEALAHDLFKELHSSFDISWCRIKIKKPQALEFTKYATVEIDG